MVCLFLKPNSYLANNFEDKTKGFTDDTLKEKKITEVTQCNAESYFHWELTNSEINQTVVTGYVTTSVLTSVSEVHKRWNICYNDVLDSLDIHTHKHMTIRITDLSVLFCVENIQVSEGTAGDHYSNFKLRPEDRLFLQQQKIAIIKTCIKINQHFRIIIWCRYFSWHIISVEFPCNVQKNVWRGSNTHRKQFGHRRFQ